MGTEFDDLLTGGEGPDFLQGLSGDDTLQAQAGNDLLYGGADDDLLQADDGIDQLYGGSGMDSLYAGSGNDKLEGGSGDDKLEGGDGNDSLTGGDGNDTLDGGNGVDRVYGGLGDDLVNDLYAVGGGGVVSIYGGDGNDRLVVWNSGGGVMDGGDGNDLISITVGRGVESRILLGGAGDDTIRSSSAGADGGSGNDVVVLNRSIYNADPNWAGSIEGGDGYDSFYYGTFYNTQDGDFADVLFFDWSAVTNFEEIIVRNFDNHINHTEPVVLTNANIGTSGDLIVRSSGAEQLGDFVDTADYWVASLVVDGSAVTTGNLILYVQGTATGGAMADTIIGAGTLSGGDGDDYISGWGGNISIPDILSGGNGNDTIIGIGVAAAFFGGEGDDDVTGSGENDVIYSGSGNDLVQGGDGADTITGDNGDDTIDGGQGADTVLYSGNFAGYTITDAFGTLTVTGPDGTDILTFVNLLTFDDLTYEVPIPGIIRIGTGDPDYIDGSDGGDSLSGGAGNDTLLGGLGDDTLTGGAGFDSLDGGAGIDTASYGDAASGDTVNLQLGTAIGGTVAAVARVQGDRLSGIDNITGSGFADAVLGNGGANLLDGAGGNDNLRGGNGNDVLIGGAEADSLYGGNGADRLEGGEGTDALWGGIGRDAFVFSTALGNNGFDLITDFVPAVDKVRLDHDMFAGLVQGRLAASALVINTTGTAADDTDRIIYQSDTGQLFFDADGSGGAYRVHFATVSAGLALTAIDFLVF